jgi:hypothetical protein
MAISTKKAFRVCEKWEFKCAYCGEKPGRSHIQIDHLIPRCKQGSDHEDNLVPACISCNQGKGGEIYIPPSLRIATDDDDCHVICQSGAWAIKAGLVGVFVSGAVYKTNRIEVAGDCYEISVDQIWDRWFIAHLSEKTWGLPHRMEDCQRVLELAKRVIRPPNVFDGEKVLERSLDQKTRLKQLRERHSAASQPHAH